MSKKKFFNLKTLISFIVSFIILSFSFVVIACPNLEKDIKKDISKHINHLNKGEISEYYNLYNTRKLSDLEKSLFYEKIRNTVKIMKSEQETFEKFRLRVKVDRVDILEKVNNNLYLCNLAVTYQIRENINTTKTIKKTDEYIVKILNLGSDGYKILLPFNSMDKDFSESETFSFLEQSYKNKKAKEIEKKRLKEENEKKDIVDDTKKEDKKFEDENGLNVNQNSTDKDKNKHEDNEKTEDVNPDSEDTNINQDKENTDSNKDKENEVDSHKENGESDKKENEA